MKLTPTNLNGKESFENEQEHVYYLFLFRALLQADVILLLGARLNWILHFGRPPRYAEDVKFIQVGQPVTQYDIYSCHNPNAI